MQSQTLSKSLPTDKFLTMAVNLLNRALLESTRTDAKKLFRQVLEGRTDEHSELANNGDAHVFMCFTQLTQS